MRSIVTNPRTGRRKWRIVAVVFVLAVAWTGWWYGPRWPVRSHTFEFLLAGSGVPVSNNQETLVCDYRGPRNKSVKPRGWAIVHLPSGKVLAQQDMGIGEREQSPDGSVLVTADTGGWKVVEVATGRTLAQTDNSSVVASPTSTIRFSRDGSRFAVESNGIAVFDTKTANLLRHLGDLQGPFDISATGDEIAAVNKTARQTQVVKVENGFVVSTLEEVDVSRLHTLQFSPDGQLLALIVQRQTVGVAEYSIQLWSLAQSKAVVNQPMSGFAYGSPLLFFSENGRFLVAEQGTSRVFDLAANPPAELTSWLAGPTRIFRYSQTGSHFLVNSLTNATVYEAGNEMPILHIKKPGMSWVLLSPDGTSLVVANQQSQSSKGIAAYLQKYIFRNAFESHSMQLIDVASGATWFTASDRMPIHINRAVNRLWTHCFQESTTPGNYKTVLEQWELQPSGPPIWLWLVSIVGVVVMFRELRPV